MLLVLIFACATATPPADVPAASPTIAPTLAPAPDAQPPPSPPEPELTPEAALRHRATGRSPLHGCPERVSELPASALFEPQDPRLQGEALIVVLKEQRRLVLFSGGERAKASEDQPACWWIGLASGYVEGHKQRRGDLRTPEGWQRTSDRPWSQFYKGISVHYPGVADAERGLRQGLITEAQRDAIVSAHARGQLPPMKTRLGGQIVIHGGGGRSDWTLGCVGMEDDDIDALRAQLPEDVRTDLLVLP